MRTTPLQKGLMSAVLMIIAWLIAFYVLKYPIESNFQFVIYLIFTAGIVWSLLDYGKQPSAEPKTFKTYFSTGFRTFVVVCFVMALFTFVFFTLNPEFRDVKIEENSKLLLQQGDHTPAEVDANAKKLKDMFMPMMISAAVFRYLIIGALVSAITAGLLSQRAATQSSPIKH